MKGRAELGRALVACLQGAGDGARALASFRDGDLAQLANHAAHHRVVPFLAVAVGATGAGAPEGAIRSLLRGHATRAAKHLLTVSDLETVVATLTAADVPFLVIKGPVLAERYYPSPDLRAYNDLDVLVRPGDFPRATDAIVAAGGQILDRNWELLRSESRGQMHVSLPLGSVADVHWHLLNRGVVREDFRIPTGELFDRRRSVAIGGGSVSTLDPVDTLLHLCLHASLSGGDRLLWLKDVERVVAGDPPDWDEVVRRARAWCAARSVAITLARSRRSLGTPVPSEVLDQLTGGPVARRLGEAIDRWFPVEASVGRMTPAVVWAQFARDSATATARALLVRSRRPVGGRRGGTPDAILRPTGTIADRGAFLNSVSEQERPGADAAPGEGPPRQ